jgi:hypothetical protein
MGACAEPSHFSGTNFVNAKAIPKHLSMFYRFVQLTAATLLVALIPLVIDFIAHPLAETGNTSIPVAVRLVYMVILLPGTLLIGVLILRRAPGNVIGLFILIWGVNLALVNMRTDLDVFWFVLRDVGTRIGWMTLIYLFLYFPDGRTFPRRTQKFFDGMYISVAATSLILIFSGPKIITVTATLDNPLFIPPLVALTPALTSLVNLASVIYIVSFIPSLLLRYRASQGIERQQLKWMALAGLAWPLMIASWLLAPAFIPTEFSSIIEIIRQIEVMLVIYAAPTLAIGAAILRYRLYDIDIIIRRTLIYSVLSSMLAIVFFGGVTVTQAIFRSITGETSDLAIVVSTLAIAALFTPLRQRVQNAIDRRFYRRKYDAEQTLAQFAALAKDEVDVEKLKAALIEAIQETMQPNKSAVWVKE